MHKERKKREHVKPKDNRMSCLVILIVVVVISSTASEQRQQIVQAEFHVLDLVATQRRLGEFPFGILKLV